MSRLNYEFMEEYMHFTNKDSEIGLQGKPIIASKPDCLLCIRFDDAASDYEWPCLIMNNWICETHCHETQDQNYVKGRTLIKEVIEYEWSEKEMLSICQQCPYRNKILR